MTKKSTPRITAMLVLRNHVTHVACIKTAGSVTSMLAKSRLANPEANLGRVLGVLVDIGCFLAITFPHLCAKDYRSLDLAQSLQYFEDAMPKFDDWTMRATVSRAYDGEREVLICDLDHRNFTTETNLLIAFARMHHHSVSDILYDAARLGVHCARTHECRILYGALLARIQALGLDKLFL